jgi:hypothetical protein
MHATYAADRRRATPRSLADAPSRHDQKVLDTCRFSAPKNRLDQHDDLHADGPVLYAGIGGQMFLGGADKKDALPKGSGALP